MNDAVKTFTDETDVLLLLVFVAGAFTFSILPTLLFEVTPERGAFFFCGILTAKWSLFALFEVFGE